MCEIRNHDTQSFFYNAKNINRIFTPRNFEIFLIILWHKLECELYKLCAVMLALKLKKKLLSKIGMIGNNNEQICKYQ